MTQPDTGAGDEPVRPPPDGGEGALSEDTSAGDRSGEVADGLALPGDRIAGRVDWEAVRQDYLHSGLSQAHIARSHGVSKQTLRSRKLACGWERVVPLERPPNRPAPAVDGLGLPPTPTELRRGRIVKRLYNLLEAKMTEIETRMADAAGHPRSAAEAERDARSLNALARLYAKLAELDGAQEKRAAQTKKTDDRKDGAHADRLRRDLAGRLARLRPGND